MKNSEKIEKSLKHWKLPPSSCSDVFGRKNGCSCTPDCKVKTVEKTIFLAPGYSSFPLFSKCHKRALKICNNYVKVGMIQVALKPSKLGSDTRSSIYLRDKRLGGDGGYDSLLGMVVSSLCDGPIYFTYYPKHPFKLSDPREAFTIDVKIQGGESVSLMYKFHYKLKKKINLNLDLVSGFCNDKKGETTFFIAHIAQGNRVVSKKMCWNRAENGESIVWSTEEAPSSSGSGDVGSAKVDWKETAEAHVLKVDVPGFKKEEVKVEVEDGRILEISGERSNDEEEVESDQQWHCEERSSGKFLRRLNMPENANLDELKAAMRNGVLTVTVPKEEAGRNPRVRKVVVDISA